MRSPCREGAIDRGSARARPGRGGDLVTAGGALALVEPRGVMAREAAEIRRELDLAEEVFERWLGHTVRVGELLSDVKGALPHGAFGRWLDAHWPRTRRQA